MWFQIDEQNKKKEKIFINLNCMPFNSCDSFISSKRKIISPSRSQCLHPLCETNATLIRVGSHLIMPGLRICNRTGIFLKNMRGIIIIEKKVVEWKREPINWMKISRKVGEFHHTWTWPQSGIFQNLGWNDNCEDVFIYFE